MPERDSIHIADSIYCQFISTEFGRDSSYIIPPLSANSLWGANTLVTPLPFYIDKQIEENNFDYLSSGLILAIFIFFIIISKEILIVIPKVIKTLFGYKNCVRFEEKLSFTNKRGLVVLFTALSYPVSILSSFGIYVEESYGFSRYLLLLGAFSLIALYWLYKTSVLRFVGWITKSKNPFNLIGKIGYNYFIISLLFTILAIIASLFFFESREVYLTYILMYSYLILLLFYLIRVYQALIAHHFSIFFFILYLCIVEILPIALLTKFLLSIT